MGGRVTSMQLNIFHPKMNKFFSVPSPVSKKKKKKEEEIILFLQTNYNKNIFMLKAVILYKMP